MLRNPYVIPTLPSPPQSFRNRLVRLRYLRIGGQIRGGKQYHGSVIFDDIAPRLRSQGRIGRWCIQAIRTNAINYFRRVSSITVRVSFSSSLTQL
jgi:hypothetical protein